MLEDREVVAVTAELFQGLDHHNFTNHARDALKGVVISSYERAVQDGLPPLDALSMILNWVAEEISRLQEAPRSVGR